MSCFKLPVGYIRWASVLQTVGDTPALYFLKLS